MAIPIYYCQWQRHAFSLAGARHVMDNGRVLPRSDGRHPGHVTGLRTWYVTYDIRQCDILYVALAHSRWGIYSKSSKSTIWHHQKEFISIIKPMRVHEKMDYFRSPQPPYAFGLSTIQSSKPRAGSVIW